MKNYDKTTKIAVLGAGAMGSFFGGLLAEKGLDVVLIDVWQEHVDKINKSGLRIIGEGGDRFVKVRATSKPAEEKPVDVVFVQCKAAHTASAIKGASNMFTEETIFVSFQNGLGNEELVEEMMGKGRVLGGLTAQGANIEGPGHIRAHTNLPTWIGEMDGKASTRVTQLCELFTAHNLPSEESLEIRKQIWCKLLYNLAVSPMSTLTDLSLREVFETPGSRVVGDLLVREGLAVAAAEGVDIPAEEADHILQKVIASRQENKTSMCVDVLKKRQSEVDFINGRVVALAKKHGINTPVNTAMVFFVKALEAKFLGDRQTWEVFQ